MNADDTMTVVMLLVAATAAIAFWMNGAQAGLAAVAIIVVLTLLNELYIRRKGGRR